METKGVNSRTRRHSPFVTIHHYSPPSVHSIELPPQSAWRQRKLFPMMHNFRQIKTLSNSSSPRPVSSPPLLPVFLRPSRRQCTQRCMIAGLMPGHPVNNSFFIKYSTKESK